MTAGRPPKPVELKRRIGNPGKRPLPKLSTVVELAPVESVAPAGLRLAGREFYSSVLAEAPWVGVTDRWVLEDVARLTDLLWELYDASVPSVRDIERITALRWKGMSSLGLDTAARSRLGVAEVKVRSKLEELRERRTRTVST